MKAFKEKDLVEKLGLNKEEVELVLKYQKLLPALLCEEEGFGVDGESLCEQLGVKDNFMTWLLGETRFNKYGNIKSQGKLIKYRMVENQHFIRSWKSPDPTINQEEIRNMSTQQRSARGIKNVVSINYNSAIKIAVKQNNEQGDLCCDYFILMEKIIRNAKSLEQAKSTEKELYDTMCKELRLFRLRECGESTRLCDYIKESDTINYLCLGATECQIRNYIKEQEENTRGQLTILLDAYLSKIQEYNIAFLRVNMEQDRRHEMVRQIFNATFQNTPRFALINTASHGEVTNV